jgi:hypothetical protein
MEKQSKQFAKGFIFKRNEKAPEWAIGKLSLKQSEAIDFINSFSKNGWLNLEVKKSRDAKFYIELDTYEAKEKENDLPF